MAAWRGLLLRIGDRGPDKCLDCGPSDEPKEHIDICAGVLLREIEYSKGEILEFLLQCAEQLPHKIPLYGVLVGLINLENEDFAKELVDITLSDLQAALNSGNVNSIHILLRFLTGLMCWKVILPGSIIEVFKTFLLSAATTIDDDSGNPSWQPCADFYAFCILSCLPWGAAELFEDGLLVSKSDFEATSLSNKRQKEILSISNTSIKQETYEDVNNVDHPYSQAIIPSRETRYRSTNNGICRAEGIKLLKNYVPCSNKVPLSVIARGA